MRSSFLASAASHPATYFVSVWVLCAFLISLNIIPQISQFSDTARMTCLALVAFNLLGALAAWIISSSSNNIGNGKSVRYLFKYRNALLILWVVVTIVEVFVSEGVPLFWIFIGNGRTYDDFGIPSLHGAMNAVYLFITLTAFMSWLSERSARSFIEFSLLLLWSLIVVSRALMAIVLLQSAVFFLINSRLAWRSKVALLSAGALGFFIVFGLLGDARVTEFSILESTGLRDIDPRWSALIWVYAYLASPIGNLALNVGVSSAQLKVVPTTFLLPLLPTAVQRWLGIETGFFGYSGYLAHDAFNVGTAFIQIFIDWGTPGMLGYAFVLGFLGHAIWRSYRRTGRSDILSLFIPCIVLTVFTNQFMQLPVILLFLLFVICTRVSSDPSSIAKQ